MIIFLYGSDGYRLRKKSGEIIDSYQKKHQSGLNFFKFDCSQITLADLDKIKDAVRSGSFFDEIKLIVLKNILPARLPAGQIAGLLKDYELARDKKTVILATANAAQKDLAAADKSLFSLLAAEGNLVKEINILSGNRLENWVKEEFTARGCSIQPAALKKLADYSGGDSFSLAADIAKLANFAAGSGKKALTGEDVELLASKKINLNIFELIDAIAAKDKPKAFSVLYRELKTGRDVNYIFAMVVGQFRNLLIIKDLAARSLSADSIAQKAGLHPFVVKKTLKILDKYDVQTLKTAYGKLLNADILQKEGRAALEDSLFGMVLSF
ncbi:MAG: polymerase III, delta subunit protein [Parcubacteria group bacterium GW2011_GWA1_48_11b]|nr:MAG: polymerase III, delta subunit protein [Parcubacteria group bacterium GW2011_GWA1_48_11b]